MWEILGGGALDGRNWPFEHAVHFANGNGVWRAGQTVAAMQSAHPFNEAGPPQTPPVVFTIYGDGKQLWSSGQITRPSIVSTGDVNVSGVNELRLETTTPRQPHGAHAVWIEPRLTK